MIRMAIPDGTFIKFLAVGVIAAAINVGSRILFSLIMSFELAVVCAFLCGLTTGFILQRLYVFQAAGTGKVTEQGARFALVNLVALVQVWVISVGLARLVFPWMGMAWHAETIANGIAVASPIMTSYFAHKHFSFAGPRTESP
jgi:putative flippase GtrA